MHLLRTEMQDSDAEGLNKARGRVELLAGRLELLSGEDRVLMEMYLKNGNSFRQLARLLGVNPATVGRRVHKLCRRLTEGGYVACLRNRSRFSAMELKIAKDYFLTGLSIRRIALRRRCSRHSIRRTLRKAEAFRVPRRA